MSDYPMLISNKLHSFRNFMVQKYINPHTILKKAGQNQLSSLSLFKNRKV